MRKCVKQEDVEIENPFSILDNFYVARTFLDAGYLYILAKMIKTFSESIKLMNMANTTLLYGEKEMTAITENLIGNLLR